MPVLPALRHIRPSRVPGTARVFATIILFAAMAVSGCGWSSDATDGPTDGSYHDGSLRFDGSAPSLDALGREVLTSLSRANTTRLEGYRLSEHEHNDVVWPELPASAPEVNFPMDYAWSNIENRNRKGLVRIIPRFADRALAFREVQCRGETERFVSFAVRTDCWVVFVTGDTLEEWEVQVFKDVLERGDGFKVFRYYDAEPRRYRREARP